MKFMEEASDPRHPHPTTLHAQYLCLSPPHRWVGVRTCVERVCATARPVRPLPTALRDIEPEEELYASYGEVYWRAKERRRGVSARSTAFCLSAPLVDLPANDNSTVQ